MRFRTKQRPRGVLRPSDQRRMMLMIAGFGLILLCFAIVRQPTFWNGMFPGEVTVSSDAAEQEQQPGPAADDGQPMPIHHDEFLTGTSDAGAAVSVTARRIPLAELPEDARGAVSGNGIPRIPKDLLKPVRDDVIGVHSTELDAYYASMKMASKLSKQHLQKAPRGAYALFLDSPSGSRGVAYRIGGQLRQLSIVKGRSNSYGVGGNRLYDAWITTPDSGDKLVHVVTMTADKSLGRLITATNKDQSVRFMGKEAPKVHFTGYFFKREGYASYQKEGLSVAPLFVSGALFEEIKPEQVYARSDEISPYVGWLTFIVAIGVVIMVWGFTVSDAAHTSTRAHQLTKLPAVASFEDISSITVGEALRDMQVESTRPVGSLDGLG